MRTVKSGQKWSREVECENCKAKLKIEEDDIKSEAGLRRDKSIDGSNYFFRCQVCGHKRYLLIGTSRHDNKDLDDIPLYVLKKAPSDY
jgi:hypothetical protein